ncbi:MAG: BLUF domain-containing protein [Polaromonas sp.]|nr:BLUF domain-containing protein [Polaromonas sp.]
MLIRLTYASTASDGVGLQEFKGILQQAQTNNHRRDLTGVLAFNSKVFLQALEGSREQVNELYARLLHDKRHHTVAVLDYEEIEEREWSNWSMGFAAPGADNRTLFMKYSGQSVFNPYAMRGSAVKKMLTELAAKTIAMTVPAEPTPLARPAAGVFAPAPASPQFSGAPRRDLPPIRPPAPVPAATSEPRPTSPAPLAPVRPAATKTDSETSIFGRFLNR